MRLKKGLRLIFVGGTTGLEIWHAANIAIKARKTAACVILLRMVFALLIEIFYLLNKYIGTLRISS
ncbi:hypothetical protein SPIROBIBN47_150190 [uncultured spirochete]|jgi:hypothetical protein|uniref:Uncharacterized protein n=1 Tax=uncultured spirochete TaxID=156406 RepID=A0A3P3XH83_9SPIR|nr:hypothetical protein SPIROBIBN47_150190 [uncultured spirochete]